MWLLFLFAKLQHYCSIWYQKKVKTRKLCRQLSFLTVCICLLSFLVKIWLLKILAHSWCRLSFVWYYCCLVKLNQKTFKFYLNKKADYRRSEFLIKIYICKCTPTFENLLFGIRRKNFWENMTDRESSTEV